MTGRDSGLYCYANVRSQLVRGIGLPALSGTCVTAERTSWLTKGQAPKYVPESKQTIGRSIHRNLCA